MKKYPRLFRLLPLWGLMLIALAIVLVPSLHDSEPLSVWAQSPIPPVPWWANCPFCSPLDPVPAPTYPPQQPYPTATQYPPQPPYPTQAVPQCRDLSECPPAPTSEPLPTNTPLPTYTAEPTYTPLPTLTPYEEQPWPRPPGD